MIWDNDMETIIILTIVLLIRSARKRKREVYVTATVQQSPPNNTLYVLREQRKQIAELITDIDLLLDNAPPNREQLRQKKIRLLGQLAQVEKRIARESRGK